MAGDGRTPAQIAYDDALYHARQAKARFDVYLRSVQGATNKRYPRARQLSAWRVLVLAVAKLEEHYRDVNGGYVPLPMSAGEVDEISDEVSRPITSAGNETSAGRRDDPAPGAGGTRRRRSGSADPAVRADAG